MFPSLSILLRQGQVAAPPADGGRQALGGLRFRTKELDRTHPPGAPKTLVKQRELLAELELVLGSASDKEKIRWAKSTMYDDPLGATTARVRIYATRVLRELVRPAGAVDATDALLPGSAWPADGRTQDPTGGVLRSEGVRAAQHSISQGFSASLLSVCTLDARDLDARAASHPNDSLELAAAGEDLCARATLAAMTASPAHRTRWAVAMLGSDAGGEVSGRLRRLAATELAKADIEDLRGVPAAGVVVALERLAAMDLPPPMPNALVAFRDSEASTRVDLVRAMLNNPHRRNYSAGEEGYLHLMLGGEDNRLRCFKSLTSPAAHLRMLSGCDPYRVADAIHDRLLNSTTMAKDFVRLVESDCDDLQSHLWAIMKRDPGLGQVWKERLSGRELLVATEWLEEFQIATDPSSTSPHGAEVVSCLNAARALDTETNGYQGRRSPKQKKQATRLAGAFADALDSLPTAADQVDWAVRAYSEGEHHGPAVAELRTVADRKIAAHALVGFVGCPPQTLIAALRTLELADDDTPMEPLFLHHHRAASDSDRLDIVVAYLQSPCISRRPWTQIRHFLGRQDLLLLAHEQTNWLDLLRSIPPARVADHLLDLAARDPGQDVVRPTLQFCEEPKIVERVLRASPRLVQWLQDTSRDADVLAHWLKAYGVELPSSA